jgi:hypothetical protein
MVVKVDHFGSPILENQKIGSKCRITFLIWVLILDTFSPVMPVLVPSLFTDVLNKKKSCGSAKRMRTIGKPPLTSIISRWGIPTYQES